MKATDITGMNIDYFPVNEGSIKALSPVSDLIVKRAVRSFLALLPITYEVPLAQTFELNPTRRTPNMSDDTHCTGINK